jgi:hypothetical protein
LLLVVATRLAHRPLRGPWPQGNHEDAAGVNAAPRHAAMPSAIVVSRHEIRVAAIGIRGRDH